MQRQDPADMIAETLTSIGRFEILRTLGKGAQGSVFLARDPRLERQVAIKSIGALAPPARIRSLLQEARVASQFSHPNIVTLFDAFEHDRSHYLVLEYVDGMTLAQLLQKEGRLDKSRAVKIAIQVAEGLVYAHGKQVIHRDIKPANVMIDANGTARIMDFGIAAMTGDQDPADTMHGTPGYMAPERLRNTSASETADVFSLGMLLYEMLAGRPAVTGASVFEIMHKTANEPFESPSSLNPEVDEALDDIVLKALLKSDAERYESAAAIKLALEEYLAPTVDCAPAPGDGKGTLQFLLRRMRHKTDFPALSQTISTINRIAADSEESVQTLSAALLKDFALTNKLLRLVNSSIYSQFGGTISTISRAVMILGFDAVRSLAITLILFEHLQNKAQASLLKEDVIAAYFTGIIAHRVAGLCGVPDSEEGFICGVFHHLGRLLAGYYFYEESAEIAKRIQTGEAEEKASRAVLGISLEELGIGIARGWNLPDKIVNSMQHVAGARAQKVRNPADKLKLAANLASELCRVASATSPARKTAELEHLIRDFSGLDLGKRQFETVVEGSVAQFLAESGLFVTDPAKSRIFKSIKQWSGNSAEEAVGDEGITLLDARQTEADAGTVEYFMTQTTMLAAEKPVDHADAAATLTAGIQDITNALVGEYNLNDVLRIILETMYRGMGFSQVLLCTRDARGNQLQARFGFGARVDTLLKSFVVPLGQAQDAFQLSLEKNVDLFIADTRAVNIVSRIPAWYREKVNAPAFLLLPLVINNKALGLFYADRDIAGEMMIEPQHMRLLKTLRNQAILAIRQKH
jgi:serine/threonine protein kinase